MLNRPHGIVCSQALLEPLQRQANAVGAGVRAGAVSPQLKHAYQSVASCVAAMAQALAQEASCAQQLQQLLTLLTSHLTVCRPPAH